MTFIKGRIPWNKGKPWPESIREKISKATKCRMASNKGISHSEKTKIKISLANTGNTWELSKITKDRMRISKMGNKNPMWKGDKVGYGAVHAWIERNYGKPKKCARCGTTVSKKFEWANISGKYLRNKKDFIRLCIKCHRKFDEKGVI